MKISRALFFAIITFALGFAGVVSAAPPAPGKPILQNTNNPNVTSLTNPTFTVSCETGDDVYLMSDGNGIGVSPDYVFGRCASGLVALTVPSGKLSTGVVHNITAIQYRLPYDFYGSYPNNLSPSSPALSLTINISTGTSGGTFPVNPTSFPDICSLKSLYSLPNLSGACNSSCPYGSQKCTMTDAYGDCTLSTPCCTPNRYCPNKGTINSTNCGGVEYTNVPLYYNGSFAYSYDSCGAYNSGTWSPDSTYSSRLSLVINQGPTANAEYCPGDHIPTSGSATITACSNSVAPLVEVCFDTSSCVAITGISNNFNGGITWDSYWAVGGGSGEAAFAGLRYIEPFQYKTSGLPVETDLGDVETPIYIGHAGHCGTATTGGGTYSSAPPTNTLCDQSRNYGNTTPTHSGSLWSWTCKGATGSCAGQDQACTALYQYQAPLVATCSVSPDSACAGTSVTWTASASGGTGSYSSYYWSGTESFYGQSVNKTYSISNGLSSTKTEHVTVTDSSGNSATSASCVATINPAVVICGNAEGGYLAGEDFPREPWDYPYNYCAIGTFTPSASTYTYRVRAINKNTQTGADQIGNWSNVVNATPPSQ